MRAAAALQPRQPVAQLHLGGMRLVTQQRRRGHDPAIEAVAALRRLFLDECRLQRVRMLWRAEAGKRKQSCRCRQRTPAASRTASARRRCARCRRRIGPIRSRNGDCRERGGRATRTAAACPDQHRPRADDHQCRERCVWTRDTSLRLVVARQLGRSAAAGQSAERGKVRAPP